MFRIMMMPYSYKTGHLIVNENWKADPTEVENLAYWKKLISNNQAVFVGNAFDVITAETEEIIHVRTIYKCVLPYIHKNGKAIIEINEMGFMSCLFNRESNTVSGFKTLMYEVFPIESETRSMSRQQQIVYEIENPKDKFCFLSGFDFNPNREL